MRGVLLLGCLLLAVAGPACALDIGDRVPIPVTVSWVTAPPALPAQPHVQLTVCIDAAADDNRAVMARLTDLARRHPDAAIVVYSASPEDTLRQLAQALGTRCGVPLGHLDSVSPYQPPVGLPWAVVSDRSRTVLWYGHPLDSAEPLVGALEGIWQVQIPRAAPETHAGDAPSVPLAVACDQPPQMPPPRVRIEQEDVVEPAGETTLLIGGPWWCWAPQPWGWCWGPRLGHGPRVPFRGGPRR